MGSGPSCAPAPLPDGRARALCLLTPHGRGTQAVGSATQPGGAGSSSPSALSTVLLRGEPLRTPETSFMPLCPSAPRGCRVAHAHAGEGPRAGAAPHPGVLRAVPYEWGVGSRWHRTGTTGDRAELRKARKPSRGTCTYVGDSDTRPALRTPVPPPRGWPAGASPPAAAARSP